jgi:hypothetical protein
MTQLPSTFWIAIATALTAAIPTIAQYFQVTLPANFQWAAPLFVTVLGTVAKTIQESYAEKKARKLARSRDPEYVATPFWSSWDFWKVIFWGKH